MQKLVAGIDVGSYHVKVVVAVEPIDPRHAPRILGTGYAESRGLRHGYVVSIPEAARSIAAAAAQASKSAGQKITRAYLSIGGVGLDEAFAKGETVVERGDSEVSERDVERVLEHCEHALPRSATLNRKVIHRIPLFFMVDGTKVMARSPIGMKGARLSVECIFITCLEQHIVDLVAAVEEAGMEVEDIVASPLAASFVAQSKMQKRVGSVLVNIGAETLSMIVFDEMVPLSVKVFPVGSSDITNDLALGLRVSPEEAEQLKHGAVLGAPYSKKKIDEMVNSRVTALFKIVESHLQKLGKSELLPGGVIITGGTASLTSVADIAKQVLKLPSRVASLADDTAKGTKNSLRDGSWTVAYGLTIWGLTQQTPTNTVLRAMPGGDLWRALLRYIKKFLP